MEVIFGTIEMYATGLVELCIDPVADRHSRQSVGQYISFEFEVDNLGVG
jgi:hypothetical protein